MYQHLVVTTATRNSSGSEILDAVSRYIYSGKATAAATDANRGTTSVLVENVPAQMVEMTCDRLRSGLYYAVAFDTVAQARVIAGLDDPTFTIDTPSVTCPRCGESAIDITVQSWETTSYVDGKKVNRETDSESLDFFGSARCLACELSLQSGGDGLKSADLYDDGEQVDDDELREAVSRLATAADVVRRLTNTGYQSTAETALGWGMGDVYGIDLALEDALRQGLVRVVDVRDTTYGRAVRFLALAPSECGYCGQETSAWPSRSCEEPLEHHRARYVCDCGDEVTVATSAPHARCHLIP